MGRTNRRRNMVKQGMIIKLNFNHQVGHEQAGYRPVVVISNNVFNNNSNEYDIATTNKFSDMIDIEIKNNEVVVKRYNAGGLYNLKSAGNVDAYNALLTDLNSFRLRELIYDSYTDLMWNTTVNSIDY